MPLRKPGWGMRRLVQLALSPSISMILPKISKREETLKNFFSRGISGVQRFPHFKSLTREGWAGVLHHDWCRKQGWFWATSGLFAPFLVQYGEETAKIVVGRFRRPRSEAMGILATRRS